MTIPNIPKPRRVTKWKGVAQRVELEYRHLAEVLTSERERIDALSKALGDALTEQGKLEVSAAFWARLCIALGTVAVAELALLLFWR